MRLKEDVNLPDDRQFTMTAVSYKNTERYPPSCLNYK